MSDLPAPSALLSTSPQPPAPLPHASSVRPLSMGPGPVEAQPLPFRWRPSQAPGLVLLKWALRPLRCGFTFCPLTVCQISHICVTREGCKGPYLMRSCRNMKKGVRQAQTPGSSGLLRGSTEWLNCFLPPLPDSLLLNWLIYILLSLPLKSWMNSLH